MQRLLLLTLLLCMCSYGIRAQSMEVDAPNGYLVQLREGADLQDWTSELQFRSNEVFELVKLISREYRLLHLASRAGSTYQKDLKTLLRNPDVLAAQLNHPVHLRNEEPDDPFWQAQWNLHRIGALQMWSQSNFRLTTAGTPIVLGILEPAGFDTEHEDLKSQIWNNAKEVPFDGLDNDHNGFPDDYMGWNAARSNDDHFSLEPHGTQVAGIASASAYNGLGISSVGWNSKLLLLSGNRFESEVIENYLYAMDLRKRFNASNGKEGALVVATNASFGISGDPVDFPIWCEMYDLLGESGILSVAAAENRAINTDLRADMPTSCSSDYLITVTGVDEMDEFLNDKAFGMQTIDIAAPAKNIYTTLPNNEYTEIQVAGNSFAAPQLTGAIGLMYSLPFPEIHQQAIRTPAALAMLMKTFIMEGALPLASLRGKIKSEGRLDLNRTYELMEAHFAPPERQLEITNIYPNPFRSQLNVDLVFPEVGRYLFRVFDLQGRMVFQQVFLNRMIGNRQVGLPLESLSSGMYTLQVTGSGATVTQKLIKY